MEFWASEVKSGESFKVQPGEGMVLHLSQACLGEIKKDKGNETICLFVNVDGKKLVLGTLFSDKLPQQQFDLVFDRDFELSHNWKNGSVYFYGYRANNPFEEEDEEGEFGSDSEEDIPLTFKNNGKSETKVKEEKPVVAKEEKPAVAKKVNSEKDSVSAKPKVKIVEPNSDTAKHGVDDDLSDEDDSISEDEDESDMDEDEDESDSDEADEEEDDSDEDTPKKVETGKKRAADSAVKTPGPDKKAKVTPQKTDGKKGGGHVATPHPSKQAGKTPANKNQQTPKSGGGSHACKSCNRTFGSENALESHTKAKHSAGK